MTGVAVLATALCTALAAAAAAGQLPALRRRRTRERSTSQIAVLLRASGSAWTPVQLVAVSAVTGLATAAVVVAASPIPALAVVPSLLGAAAPAAVLRQRARRRRQAIRRAWPDALAMVRGAVQAGRPLSHALIDVSLDGPPVLRVALTGLAARIQTVGLVPALEALRLRVADPVTDRVVEVLVLAHTEGGRIVADVLADLAEVVDAELATAEEIDALALEGRLNARIVFAIPWAVLVLLTAGAGPFRDFYATAAGTGVIGLGAVVSLLGIALVSRMSRLPEDPRVLVPPGGGPR